MRIACVDKTAAERMALERFLDESFKECRKSIGHLVVARLNPVSKEELLINKLPDCVVLGSGFEVDESLLLVREIRAISNNIPIYVFLTSLNYTVKNLKRFSGYASDVFSVVDLPSRFVFKLTSVQSIHNDSNKGCLLAFQGVKGGVGTTSIVGGAAHALQDLGKTVVVVDLSRRGEFCQFFLSEKWQSSYYSQLISDCRLPDQEHVEKALIYLQNGIPVMPPPSGADELREQWLRDPTRLEIGLSFLELLLEKYDVVLVDFAHAEGILPFAIECRADARIFVAANDPGSIHLLVQRVGDFSLPVEGETRFLINQTHRDGLTKEDILDFVSWSSDFSEEMLYPELVPYEKDGGYWMGTGNSFFTESNLELQDVLKRFISAAIGLDIELKSKKRRLPFKNPFKSISSTRAKTLIPFANRDMLPYYGGVGNIDKSKPTETKNKNDKLRLRNSDISEISLSKTKSNISESEIDPTDVEEQDFLYDPPRIRANE